MALININPQRVSLASAIGAGSLMVTADTYHPLNTGRTILYFIGTGTAATITIAVPGTIDGLAIANKTISVPANAHVVVGTFDSKYYNLPNGRMSISTNQANVSLYCYEV